MYKLMLKLHENNTTKFKWISYKKSIMDDCGLSCMWNDQVPIDKFLLKTTIRQKLSDQFLQHWFSQINNTSRGEFYSLFRNEFQLESYLLKLTQGERINITKFRCSNIKGVSMIRVDFGPISETVYIDIILNTIIER